MARHKLPTDNWTCCIFAQRQISLFYSLKLSSEGSLIVKFGRFVNNHDFLLRTSITALGSRAILVRLTKRHIIIYQLVFLQEGCHCCCPWAASPVGKTDR